MINELSVIIPALNEAEYLPHLLDSLAAQTFKGKLQVIVVDAKSEDRTFEIAKSYERNLSDLLVLSTKKDIGYQKNLGVKHAKYKYLLFLDADVVLPPDVLLRLAGKVKTDRAFIISVMHSFSNMSLIDTLFYYLGYSLLLICLACRFPVTNGDFMLTSRDNHDAIEGFVEGALLGEDVDYGRRSKLAGAKLHFYFQPRIFASFRRARTMGRAKLLFLWFPAFMRIRKHGPVFPGQGLEYPFGHYGKRKD